MPTIAAAIEEEAPNQSPETIQDHKMSTAELLSKLISQELDLMTSVDVSPQAAKNLIDQLWGQINQARNKFNKLQTRNGPSSSSSSAIASGNGDDLEIERDLRRLSWEVRELKSRFPFSLFKIPNNYMIQNWRDPSPSIGSTHPHQLARRIYSNWDDYQHQLARRFYNWRDHPHQLEINRRDRSTPHFVFAAPDKLMQNLITSDYFNRTPTSPEMEACEERINNYMIQNANMKNLVGQFLVSPDYTIMKKNLLVRWAEVSAAGDQGTQLIQQLITKGLIHPVYKDTLTVGGYWMPPFVRSILSDHNWLLDKVYVTDNSSEDIIYDDPTPFLAAEKKELSILHLGIWQRSSLRHIEVEDANSFFKDMAKLSELRYVSLRGVSLVTELPQFITKLKVLQTLDLKSCHNLEVIPSSIGKLASRLTHLDMSECYILEDMPMALSELRSLRVLKGFVVREDIKENSCTLRDLISLHNLRKLNVHTSVRSFPNRNELHALTLLSSLQSLTISWGRCSLPKAETGNSESTATTSALEHQRRHERKKPQSPLFSFDGLDKLDLQCVPETVTHDWLNPANFRNLKKLYIRGGRFRDLGQEEGQIIEEYTRDGRVLHDDMKDYQWRSVDILRLKHLENLEMDYRVLQCLFPKLICLENVKCPNLKNFPCNDGVWKDNTKPPPTTYI